MKLKITDIGLPKQVQTKYGLKEKNWLKAQEFGDKYLNYWVGENTKAWKVGDEIEVLSVEQRDYIGKDNTPKVSYDIKLPKTGGEIYKRIEKLENEVTKLDLKVAELEDDYPEYKGQPNFEPEEAPF